MKLHVMAFVGFLSLQLNAQSDPKTVFDQKFPSHMVQEDLKMLKTGLEKIHPGLYRYTAKKTVDSMFTKVQSLSNFPMTYRAFYREICNLVAQIKCQHTIATPDSELLGKIMDKGRFFPLKIFWEFEPEKAYVTSDFSSMADLSPGTQIVGINGQSMANIYGRLIPYFPSDGEIRSNKHSRLQTGMEFQFWYYLLMDSSEYFTVELKGKDGGTFTKIHRAVTQEEWKRNYKKYTSHKNPEIRKYLDHYGAKERTKRENPIRYEFLSDDIALLTVGNFYAPNFKAVVYEAFKKIKDKGVGNLIVDVRNNGGGNDDLGRHLLSYLVDRPTAYLDSLYTNAGIADTTFLFKHTDKNAEWMKATLPFVEQMEDGRFATLPTAHQGLLLQQPSENRFQGNLYVLMNGRSASTTAEFTSVLHFNKRAIFIGEESGGAYHGGHGGDFAQLRLPNTKITVQIPLSKYVMNSKETKLIGKGTLPDYPIQTTIQDILELRDSQLDFALKLLKEN
ncbi:S41 family peptidase [Flavobacteriaceae bacterium GF1]